MNRKPSQPAKSARNQNKTPRTVHKKKQSSQTNRSIKSSNAKKIPVNYKQLRLPITDDIQRQLEIIPTSKDIQSQRILSPSNVQKIFPQNQQQIVNQQENEQKNQDSREIQFQQLQQNYMDESELLKQKIEELQNLIQISKNNEYQLEEELIEQQKINSETIEKYYEQKEQHLLEKDNIRNMMEERVQQMVQTEKLKWRNEVNQGLIEIDRLRYINFQPSTILKTLSPGPQFDDINHSNITNMLSHRRHISDQPNFTSKFESVKSDEDLKCDKLKQDDNLQEKQAKSVISHHMPTNTSIYTPKKQIISTFQSRDQSENLIKQHVISQIQRNKLNNEITAQKGNLSYNQMQNQVKFLKDDLKRVKRDNKFLLEKLSN